MLRNCISCVLLCEDASFCQQRRKAVSSTADVKYSVLQQGTVYPKVISVNFITSRLSRTFFIRLLVHDGAHCHEKFAL